MALVYAAQPKLLRDALGSFMEPIARCNDGSPAFFEIGGEFGLDLTAGVPLTFGTASI
jgi:hypothetical protein